VIGQSAAFKAMLAAVERLAPYEVPVLIEGETGTGKELVARAIHYRSRRRDQPYVPVNCGSLPDTLIENELFGHRRGAFTDARDDQAGLVALAGRGTLLLDEVDTLTLRGQAALLRFLQDQSYRPLGGRTSASADVRVLAASNRDLAKLTAAGAFRRDLLYRLEVLHVQVPPLRERRGDALVLAEHFRAVAAERFELPPRPLSTQTRDWLDEYAWPGNVRELENLVYRASIMGDGEQLVIGQPGPARDRGRSAGGALRYREAKARAIATFETGYLEDVMARAAWNVSEAARLIGTERRHLGRLLKKYGIQRQP